MRQFKRTLGDRTWGDHDGDRDDFHFGDFFGHCARLGGGDLALFDELAERGLDFFLGDHRGADPGEQCFLDDIDHGNRSITQIRASAITGMAG